MRQCTHKSVPFDEKQKERLALGQNTQRSEMHGNKHESGLKGGDTGREKVDRVTVHTQTAICLVVVSRKKDTLWDRIRRER